MTYPHGDWGWGVPSMIVLMFAFWVLVIVGVAWIATRLGRSAPPDDAREVLDRRLAQGDIDEPEYRSRLGVLTGARSGGAIDDDG